MTVKTSAEQPLHEHIKGSGYRTHPAPPARDTFKSVVVEFVIVSTRSEIIAADAASCLAAHATFLALGTEAGNVHVMDLNSGQDSARADRKALNRRCEALYDEVARVKDVQPGDAPRAGAPGPDAPPLVQPIAEGFPSAAYFAPPTGVVMVSAIASRRDS